MKNRRSRRAAPPALAWLSDLSGRTARITSIGGHSLLVENHCGILEFTQERISLATRCGTIDVSGSGLSLTEVRRDALVTIEGNTGAGSDANGGQVQRRERPYRYVLGAYRPAYEEETMTQQQFDALMEAWLERRAEQAPGAFSAEARAWAEETGLIRGDSAGRKQYKSFCTREQLMTFLYRLVQKE